MIFDVKMEDINLKARLLTGVHVIEPPATITYESIESRGTFSIALTLAALNYFPVKVAHIKNDFITAHVTYKIWTVLIPDFGKHAVRKAILVHALYGLKSAGAAFQNHWEYCMHHLVFLPCPAELDIWTKPMVMPDYGFNYYTYVLIHVEYVMVIQHDAEIVLRRIDKYSKLNPSSIFLTLTFIWGPS